MSVSGTYSTEHRVVTGPKHIHGSVTLDFEPSESFGFESLVEWPPGGNYDEFVRFGVYSALFSSLNGNNGVCVKATLKEIEFEEFNSCAVGFQEAAKKATHTALRAAGFEIYDI